MLDPEAVPPTDPTSDAAAPGYLPFVAYPGAYPPLPPPAPTWTRAYEVPTARKVVSTGLQLALDASRPIRRASIYIGLLALGALGPGVLLLLVGIARLLSDPSLADQLSTDPSQLFLDQPGIAGPFVLIEVTVGLGFLLLSVISIEAQAMAIAILAGRASETPVPLWQAVVRARQVFWRLAGATFLVGLGSTVVALVITVPFIRPFDSNTGVSFIGSAVGALVVMPFAFAATGVVLGDVGATEAIRRSVSLFRARPRIAFAVTLFTLVTSAIETFALGAGADVATRAATFMHLRLEDGGVGLILPIVLVLMFIVAFGSLTFTIAAIVAAPQVAGFLGLTYYSGGLDRARTPDGARPARFRWVNVPMALTMAGLVVLAGFGLSSVAGYQPRAASPLLLFLRTAAQARGDVVSPFGAPNVVDDPFGDGGAGGDLAADIASAEYGYLPDVPSWFLDGPFACTTSGVTCDRGGSDDAAFAGEGALLFVQRMVGPPGSIDILGRDWGPELRVDETRSLLSPAGDRFPGASHVILTHFEEQTRTIALFERFSGGQFFERTTQARSLWVGNDLITLVPVQDLPGWPVTWDMYAGGGSATAARAGADTLRAAASGPMLSFDEPIFYAFTHGPQASP